MAAVGGRHARHRPLRRVRAARVARRKLALRHPPLRASRALATGVAHPRSRGASGLSGSGMRRRTVSFARRAGGELSVFFYARLWRRSGVMTDIEFTEIRYAGKPAAFLRGFRALYLGIPINCIVLGLVNLAMVKILMLVLGVTRIEALGLVLG